MTEAVKDLDISRHIMGVTWSLVKHPVDTLVWRWNWKAALLSALLRSPIFFTAYLFQKQGLRVAAGAMAAQFIFRTLYGGANGAIIQSYSKVEPAWHAVVTIPLVLTALSHVAEWVVQSFYDSYTGTTGKGKAILISVLVSVISAVFNLFAMRRGALLVKDESEQSLFRDLIRMPWIIFEFVSFPLVWTWKKTKKRTDSSDSRASEYP